MECQDAIIYINFGIQCINYPSYLHLLQSNKRNLTASYRVILLVLDPRKCEYLKDYSLDFEHAYMTTYLAS